jgi:subtilisin family serine protease
MTMLTTKTTRLMLILAAMALMVLSASVAFGQSKPATTDVIIGFNSTPGAAENAMIDGVGGTVNGTFSIIPAMSATVPNSAVKGLRSNPNVAYVEEDGYKELHTDSSVGELQWGTNRIDAEAVWDAVGGNSGAGVRVADLDTGIDASHPDLDGNIIETWSVAGKADALNPNTDATDRNGHGTASSSRRRHCDGGIGWEQQWR